VEERWSIGRRGACGPQIRDPRKASNFDESLNVSRHLLLQIVVRGDGCRYAALTSHLQIAADEGLEIAIKHTVYVADFYTGAEVFGHAVGLKDVAADL
jgi:hypothetical protein